MKAASRRVISSGGACNHMSTTKPLKKSRHHSFAALLTGLLRKRTRRRVSCGMDTHLLLEVHGFGFTSKTAWERKKQTSNSMKKLTCPSKMGTESLFVHANASRTGANFPTVAATTSARAS